MNFIDLLKELSQRIDKVIKDQNSVRFTNNTYSLGDCILCLENTQGCARHPYQNNGMLLWVNQDGKISLNDANFYLIPESLEGESNALAFFLGMKNGDDYKPISLFEFNKNIYEGNIKRYTVFYPTFAVFLTEYDGVIYGARLAINTKRSLIIETALINNGKEAKDLYTSCFLNFKFMHGNYDSVETKWFKKASYKNNSFSLFTVEDFSRTEHVSNYGSFTRYISRNGVEIENTTSRSIYSSSRTGRIENSKALIKGKFEKRKDVTMFSEMSSCGDIIKFKLNPNESITIDYNLSVLKSFDDLVSLDGDSIENDFEFLDKESKKKRESKEYLSISFKDSTFIDEAKLNSFINKLIDQVDYCASTKNSSLSMLGIRDAFQAIEAANYFERDNMRSRIVELMNYLDDTGRFPRQVTIKNPDDKNCIIDNREFIDQGFWVIDAVYGYLSITDDYSILDEQAGYIHVVNPRNASVSSKMSSILQHFFEMMDFYKKNIDSKTGCMKTLYGDWNDAIDGLGSSDNDQEKFGNGVSIMATFQYYMSLNKMAEILIKISGHEDKVKEFTVEAKNLELSIKQNAFVEKDTEFKILHGWGNNQEFYVGSFCDIDKQERDTLTSNAFYIISEYFKKDSKYISSVLKAYKKLDSKYGFKTFNPYFSQESRKVGRIVNLPKGTAENAATYIHSAAFAIDSLFRINEDRWAWESLKKVLPFTHDYVTSTPFVMPNSYVYNPEILCDGESMNDWFTGSSNTILKLLIRSAFGLNVNLDYLIIKTASYFPFKEATIKVKINNSYITLVHKSLGSGRRITLNNKELELINDNGRLIATIAKNSLPDECLIEVID